MSQKLLIILLTIGTIFFLSGILFLNKKTPVKTFIYDTYTRRLLSQIYLQNAVIPNMQSGFNLVNPKKLKESSVYWQWAPKKNITAIIQFENVPQKNIPNRIIFRAHIENALSQIQNLDASSAASMAKNIWVTIPNTNMWICTKNTDKTISCLTYAQSNSGKNDYFLTTDQGILFATSCFIPKNSPLYTTKTQCPPI